MHKSMLPLAVLALAMLPVGTVAAAPQALALMATNGTVPFTCADGTCSVELSTFCLQQDRESPKAGTLYRLAAVKGVRLVASDGSGRTFRLPMPESLRISAERGYWAVTLSLPETTLAAIDGQRIAVDVGENVSLLPIETLWDAEPQGEAEALIATGPWRDVGRRVVDQSGTRAGTVRVTNRLINRLPKGRRATAGERSNAWRQAVDGGMSGSGGEAVGRAKAIFAYCQRPPESGRRLKQCLQQQHDLMLTDLTENYWKAVAGPGS
jgi:hypothetical protein